MARDKIIIANAGGFWGDDPTAAQRQVEGGPIDYLVMDYLAEITMAILQKHKSRNPEAGFATDFVMQLAAVLPACLERGITVIANAGGVNPLACRAAVEALAEQQGVASKLRVGVILGDDIYGDLDSILESGEALANLDNGAPLSQIRDKVLSANAYLGAAPVAKALEMGANVIIAGRVTDTAVTLGPMIHEFGWKDDEWDRLATGIIAGHIIECGTQCTGGNFTDWKKVPSFSKIGYPLVEAHPDGTFVITKHPGTGGLVTSHTVGEQLLYEMGTPSYLAPDCVAHFDSIRLDQEGPDRVRVSEIRGDPPPEKLKVSVSFAQGYSIVGRLMISGPNSLEKASKAAEIFWGMAGGRDFYERTSTSFIGWNACHPPLSEYDPSETLVQVGARDADRAKLDTRFGPFVIAGALGSVPGLTAPGDQGRPRSSPVIGYWPALISRDKVRVTVHVGDAEEEVSMAVPSGQPGGAVPPQAAGSRTTYVDVGAEAAQGGPQVTVPLGRLCLARSGDKGDTSNVGVIARTPAVYKWVLQNLTTDFMKDRFAGLCEGSVERHELPNLLSVNFLLHEALGGGGTLSVRFDAQGKTYAQYLLATPVTVDQGLLDQIGD